MKKKVHREPLTSDVIFKAVFGRDTPGCKRALIGLLNRILEREEDPIVDLVYQNPFSMAELEEEKEIIMDILVETQSGEQIDIEMQIGTTKDLMNRFLYYLSKLVVRGLEKGEDYGKLKKSIVIVILWDTYFPESEPPHSCFMLKKQRNRENFERDDAASHSGIGKVSMGREGGGGTESAGSAERIYELLWRSGKGSVCGTAAGDWR